MTMLGRVRRRQADDDPTLDGRRPASSTRGSDFCKALMVEAQRLQLEYVIHGSAELMNTLLIRCM
jgi:hypothetical protein